MGNLERQHRTLKNSIFILCEERSCQWLDILQEVVSNMNSMTNMSTGVSPHYIVTGRHPSLNLPNADNDKNRNPDPKLYGMNLSRQLIKVHKAVAIAAAEADEKMESRLNSSPTKPLNPGDKVLLYRPVSAEAKRNKLPWLEGYTVVQSNNMVVKIRNEDNLTFWVHRTQLRYVPDRPEHLLKPRPLMIPVPVMPQGPTQIPQPPSEGRRTQIGGPKTKRQSKIPIPVESGRKQNIRRTEPLQNPKIGSQIARVPVKSTNRVTRVDKSTTHSRTSVEPSSKTGRTGRYPQRTNRQPPKRFEDYVKF